ncbi:olfactory receptor 5M8-like [Elephas maximus indicus]|uniref:olfactory receptor 5M8-like n=1 Tax=Elephas maximus indicus TaxID=99487 RepID=UPI0021166092|nr:olfactory receptor 5M8-like [Elephas maximus indicus]
MARGNYSLVTEFILLGLTDHPDLQPILFVLFLLIYLITVGGNLGMMVLIRIDSHLHTPMYFFLASLSCLDLCYSTNVTPKMLVNFLSDKKTISYVACLIQCYFFIAMVITEYYMLAVMAYDRYMAICNPLLYSSKMSKGVCICLIAGPYVYGFLSGLMETMWTYRLTFCGSNIINHFYCADPPLIRLSCSDTYIKETSMFKIMRSNFTSVNEFILLGLTSHWELQIVFFLLFLVIYMVTVAGNLGMIILIHVNAQLHTPMYFFLSHLSFVDLCFSTNVTPKMLEIFLSEKKTISYSACLVQCYFFIALVHVEIYVLAVMAFDRYMAICNPLLYGSKMSKSVCASLITVPYVYGALTGLMEIMWTYNLVFCGPNEINHFCCADPPLIKLACSDTYKKELSMFVVAGFNFSYSFLVILTSYIYIFPAIFRIQSTEGRRKAFSTCGSHLTAVIIFYAALSFMYLRPPSEESVEQGKMVAVFYTTVIPMLNPMIYSLRNKDVKEALTKELFRRKLPLK